MTITLIKLNMTINLINMIVITTRTPAETDGEEMGNNDATNGRVRIGSYDVESVETRRLNPLAYSDTRRVDVYQHYLELIRSNPIQEYRHMVDIDAIFTFTPIVSVENFKGHEIMLEAPNFDRKRERKNFIAMTGMDPSTTSCFKIGTTGSSNDLLIDIFIGAEISNSNNSNGEGEIGRCVRHSFDYAIKKKCMDPLTRRLLHANCKSAEYQFTVDSYSSPVKKEMISLTFVIDAFVIEFN